MNSFFCPNCNGRIAPVAGIVVMAQPGGTPRWRREIFLACLGCPTVSQIEHDTGNLPELHPLTLHDLDAPFTPGDDDPHFVRRVQPLRGRKDS